MDSKVKDVVVVVQSLVLCAIGIVGEYVGRVFDQVKGRPVYVLKDESPSFAAGAGATSKRREAA